MFAFFDIGERSRAILIATSLGDLLPAILAGVVLLAGLIASIALVLATPLSESMIRFRARRLPQPLADRLLEEWLGEVAGIEQRARRLSFAIGLIFTRSKSLVSAASADGESAVAPGSVLLSVDDVRVPSEISTRLVAGLLDLLVLAPLSLTLSLLVALPFPYQFLNAVIVGTAVTLFVDVFFVLRLGGSPGKLLMKIRIVTFDDSPMTLRHALLRVAPYLLPRILVAVVATSALASSGISETAFAALDAASRKQLLIALMPAVTFSILKLAQQILPWVDTFVAYHNPDRRSLHDVIAGTLVVYTVPRVVGDPEASSPRSTSLMR